MPRKRTSFSPERPLGFCLCIKFHYCVDKKGGNGGDIQATTLYTARARAFISDETLNSALEYQIGAFLDVLV